MTERFYAGLAVLAAMMLANWFLLGGAGGVLLLAPIGWVVWGYREKRHRAAYLRRHGNQHR